MSDAVFTDVFLKTCAAIVGSFSTGAAGALSTGVRISLPFGSTNATREGVDEAVYHKPPVKRVNELFPDRIINERVNSAINIHMNFPSVY